jgi:hypothetical protein
MKKILLGLLYMPLLFACKKAERIDVRDVSQPELLVLTNKKDIYVDKAEIRVKGYVNDTAMIGGVKTNKGNLDFVWYSSDFYEDTFYIQYKPYKADSGHISLYYRMSGFKK